MTETQNSKKADQFYDNERKLNRMNSRELNRILIVNQKEPSVIANVETDSDSAEDIDQNKRELEKELARSRKDREKRMKKKKMIAYDLPQNSGGLLGKMHYFTQLVDHGVKYQMHRDDEYSPTGNSWNQSDIDEAYHSYDPNLYPKEQAAKLQKQIKEDQDSINNEEEKQNDGRVDQQNNLEAPPNLDTFGGYVELRSQQSGSPRKQQSPEKKNFSVLKQKGGTQSKEATKRKENQKVMWDAPNFEQQIKEETNKEQQKGQGTKPPTQASLNLTTINQHNSGSNSQYTTTNQSSVEQSKTTSPRIYHQKSPSKRKQKQFQQRQEAPTHVSLAGADITPVLINDYEPETPFLGPQTRQKSKKSPKTRKGHQRSSPYESPRQREERIDQIVKRLSQSSKQARDKRQVLEQNKLTTLKLQRIDSSTRGRNKQNSDAEDESPREGTPDKISRQFKERALKYKIGKQTDADPQVVDFKETMAFYKDEWDLTTKSLYNPSTAVKFEAYIENLGKTVTAQLSRKLGQRVRIGIKDGSKAKKIQIFITTHHQQKWQLTQQGYGHGYGLKDKLSPEDALLQHVLETSQTPKALQGLQGKQKREAIKMIRKSFVPELTKKEPKPIKDAQKALTLTCRRKLPIDSKGNLIQVFSKYSNNDFLESRPVSMTRQTALLKHMQQAEQMEFQGNSNHYDSQQNVGGIANQEHLTVQQLQTVDTVTENSLINNVPAYLEQAYGRLLIPSEMRRGDNKNANGNGNNFDQDSHIQLTNVERKLSSTVGSEKDYYAYSPHHHQSYLPEFKTHSKKASDSNLQNFASLKSFKADFIAQKKSKNVSQKKENLLPNTEEGRARHDRWISKVEKLIGQFDLDKEDKSAAEQCQLDEAAKELSHAKQLLIEQFTEAVENNEAKLVEQMYDSDLDSNGQNDDVDAVNEYSGGESVDTPTRKRRLENFEAAQRRESMQRTFQTEDQRADYAQMLKKMHDKYAELEVRASMTMSHKWNAAKELVKYQMKNQDRRARLQRLKNQRKKGVFTRAANQRSNRISLTNNSNGSLGQFGNANKRASNKSMSKSHISQISSQQDIKSGRNQQSQDQRKFISPQDLFRKLEDEKVQREAIKAKNLSKRSFKGSSRQFFNVASQSSNPQMRQNSSLNFKEFHVGESNLISSQHSYDDKNSSRNQLIGSQSHRGAKESRNDKRQLYLTTQDIPRMLNQQSTISFNKRSSHHLMRQRDQNDSNRENSLNKTLNENATESSKLIRNQNNVDEGKVFDRNKFFQELAEMGVRVPQRHMQTFEKERRKNESNSPQINTSLSQFLNKKDSQKSGIEEKSASNILPKAFVNARQLSTPKNPTLMPLEKLPTQTNFSKIEEKNTMDQQQTPNSVDLEQKIKKLNQTARTNLFIRDEMLQQPIPEQMFSESSHDGARQIETPTLPSQVGDIVAQVDDKNQRLGLSRDFGRRFQEHLNRMSRKELPEINSPETIPISRQSLDKKEDDGGSVSQNTIQAESMQRPSLFEMMHHRKVSVKFKQRKNNLATMQQNHLMQTTQMTSQSGNRDLDSLLETSQKDGKENRRRHVQVTVGVPHFSQVSKSAKESKKLQQAHQAVQNQANSSVYKTVKQIYALDKPQPVALKSTLQKAFMNHKSPEEKRILKKIQRNELLESHQKYPKQNLTPKLLSQDPSKYLSKTQLHVDSKASFGFQAASSQKLQLQQQQSSRQIKNSDFQPNRQNVSMSPLQMMLQEMKHEKQEGANNSLHQNNDDTLGQDQIDLSHIMGKSTISAFDQVNKNDSEMVKQQANNNLNMMLQSQTKYTPQSNTLLNETMSDFGTAQKLKETIFTQRFRSQIKQRVGGNGQIQGNQITGLQQINVPHTAEILPKFNSRPVQNKRRQNQSVPPRISFENKHPLMLSTVLNKPSLINQTHTKFGEAKTFDQQSLKSQLRAHKLAQMNQTAQNVDFGISRNKVKKSANSVFSESLPPMVSSTVMNQIEQTTAQSSRFGGQTTLFTHQRNQSQPFAVVDYQLKQQQQSRTSPQQQNYPTQQIGSMQQLLASLTPKQGFGGASTDKKVKQHELLSTKHVSYQHVPGMEKDPTEFALGVAGSLMDESRKVRYTYRQFQRDASKEHTKNILPSMAKLL